VKGTLGVLISLTLAATTPLRDLLLGMQRLRAPALVVTIATLMLRYTDLIVAEARRMRLARLARGTTRGSCGRSAPPRAGRRAVHRGPTSAASGCTWRCCRAAGPGAMPRAADAPPPPGGTGWSAQPGRGAAALRGRGG
jgi:cobalt/nickel transport system permease protein